MKKSILKMMLLIGSVAHAPFSFSTSKGDQTGPVSANGKLSPVLVEESLMLKNLQGEWKQECHKVGKYYVQSKVLYIENVIISSWKWYDTADCKAQPIGEYWDQWQVISEDVSQESNVVKIKMALMDGYSKQCPELWITASLSNDNGLLYFGDRYDGTEKSLDCLEWPTELEDTPFLFSRPLADDESIKEYTSSLKRVY